MVAGATTINEPVRSWMEQSLCVLKNSTTQIAAPFQTLQLMKELHDPVVNEEIQRKIFGAERFGVTFASSFAAVQEVKQLNTLLHFCTNNSSLGY